MYRAVEKKTIIVLLLLPLVISTGFFVSVYITDTTAYYQTYTSIIENNFPDYAVLQKDILYEKVNNYDPQTIIQNLSLESFFNMGFFECQLVLGENQLSNVIVVFAPSKFFTNYSNIQLSKGEFLLSYSGRRTTLTENATIPALFVISDMINSTTELHFKHYIRIEEVFNNNMLNAIQHSVLEKWNIQAVFMTVDTFEDVFTLYVNQLIVNNANLFLFKREQLLSKELPEIIRYLDYMENQTNSYFNYYEREEDIYQNFTLKRKLMEFNDDYKDAHLMELMIVFSILIFICYLLLSFTVKIYIDNEYSKFLFFQMRGVKRYKILQMFAKLELKLVAFTFLIFFAVSLILIDILEPLIFKQLQNYGRLLSFTVLSSSLIGCVQLLMTYRYFNTKMHVKNQSLEHISSKKLKLIALKAINTLVYELSPAALLAFASGLGLYYVVFTQLFSTGYSNLLLSLFTVTFIIMLFLVLKGYIFSTLLRANSILFSKLHQTFVYSKDLTEKVLHKYQSILKGLLIFSLVVSFTVATFDTWNAYVERSRAFNQIGDLTISYPLFCANEVQQALSPYIQGSIEFYHLEVGVTIFDETYDTIQTLVGAYFINQSKIQILFNTSQVKEVFSNEAELDNSAEIFNNNNYSVLLSEQIASDTRKNFNDTLWISVEQANVSNLLTRVAGIIPTFPVFSWMSAYYHSRGYPPNFMLVNGNSLLNKNADLPKDLQIFSVLFMQQDQRKQALALIDNLNTYHHFGINIINFRDLNPIDPDIASVLLNSNRILAIFILVSIGLCCFLFQYFITIYADQIEGFKILFARGLSIKKGLLLALLPLITIVIQHIIVGSIFGWILAKLFVLNIQLKYYLTIKLYLLPKSLLVLGVSVVTMLLISGIITMAKYFALRRSLPVVVVDGNPLLLLEGDTE